MHVEHQRLKRLVASTKLEKPGFKKKWISQKHKLISDCDALMQDVRFHILEQIQYRL